jgi:hypothetical protein
VIFYRLSAGGSCYGNLIILHDIRIRARRDRSISCNASIERVGVIVAPVGAASKTYVNKGYNGLSGIS